MIDAEKYYTNLFEVYRYTGLDDINVYKNQYTAGLLASLPEKFINLALHYREQEEMEKARAVLEKAIQVAPDYYRPYVLLYRLLREEGKTEESDTVLDAGETRLEQLVERYPEIIHYHQSLGLIYQVGNKLEESVSSFKKALELNPSDRTSFQILGQILASSEKYEQLVELMERWVKDNPDDQEAKRILEQYRNTP